jgi:hypothetical protein
MDQGRFRLERDMGPIAQNWLERDGFIVKSEFQTRWGICDFVGVEFNPQRVVKRIKFGQKSPIGPESRIAILQSIPHDKSARGISLKSLAMLFKEYLSAREISTNLKYLQDCNFVVRTSTGNYKRLNGWAPLHKRIIALELKLTRVEDAINQAMANCSFATESFVGLPETLANKVALSSRASQFRALGIGLLAIAEDGCETLIYPSRMHSPDIILQMHCVERFWRSA